MAASAACAVEVWAVTRSYPACTFPAAPPSTSSDGTAAVCASALPFVVYDEGLYSLLLHPPSSSKLYRICWLDICQNLHCPTLATLQTCLLLQQRLPTTAAVQQGCWHGQTPVSAPLHTCRSSSRHHPLTG